MSINTGNIRFFGPSGGSGGGSVGPTGATGPVSRQLSDAFSVYMGQDFTISEEFTIIPITNWTSTLNQSDFPLGATAGVFQNTNYNTLDLVDGTYTIGSSGQGTYFYSVWFNLGIGESGYFILFTINGGVVVPTTPSWSGVVNLVPGDVCSVSVYSGETGTIEFDTGAWPSISWTMSLISLN